MHIESFIHQITQEAVLLTILLSLPSILASLLVGLSVALFSATTQIQEQTLSFAPKMIAVFVALALSGSWMASLLVKFAIRCFSEITYTGF